jgi:hypothetical protein
VASAFALSLNNNKKANEEIYLKWMHAKVTCPNNADEMSIILLNQKGYLPAFFLRSDRHLLRHLQNNNKDIVKLIVSYKGMNNGSASQMSLVSLSGYEINNSWLLKKNKDCLIGEIKGHNEAK